MPSQFESKEAEEKWSMVWETAGTYRYSEDSPAPRYVIDTPPPTVSGSLHVGHVFSYTQTDVIARYQRMRGRNVFYPMGWDDNGLPTERRVQNYFHVRCEPGAEAFDVSTLEQADEAARKMAPRKLQRGAFIDLCVKLTAEDEKAFKTLWQRLGLSVDWSQEYSTISEHSRRIAQLSFLDLFDKKHVYTLEAPTMWDVDFKTAVAQAEVEDRPMKGAFHKIRFAVEGGGDFTIATTRPELLPACVAVAAHPDDERYRALIGKNAITPLFRAPVPIFGSPLVDPTKGTGILMVCTFGDATDVQWWREEKLPLRQTIGRDGRMAMVEFGSAEFPSQDAAAANAAYATIVGKSMSESRRLIVVALRDPSGSADNDGTAPLVSEPEPLEHSVKFFEKGDRPLEFVSSRQWFVRLLNQRDKLIEMGDKIEWHPDFMRMRFKNWTENLQIDWCISRQRYFGVPIPVWYKVSAGGQTDFAAPMVPEASRLPVDPTVDTPTGFTEAQRDHPDGFTADPDVFDTWFTSSLSPQIASGWSLDPERHKKLFPMDVRPQSHEIIRTWAFYTIAKAWLHEGAIPWKRVAISGWVLDPDRKKMSKSKGNVVTPMHLLDQYGSDAVRYWSLAARLGVDTAFDEKVLKVGRRLVVKVYNATRYVLGQEAPEGPITHPLDLGFLHQLQESISKATALLDAMDYASALDVIERFFWDSFTDSYLELAKSRARSESDPNGRASAVAALRQGMGVLLRLLAPYLPYVTEEAWSWDFAGDAGASIHVGSWPEADELSTLGTSREDATVYELAKGALGAINRAKTQAGGTVGRHVASLTLAAPQRVLDLFKRAESDILAATRVLSLTTTVMADNAEFDLGSAVTQIELAPVPEKPPF
ncbi:MAG: valine--tRNA ligase [Vicinamibacteria bacterium]|nr:valine--tRNA ligase [Vicinamibacteria bacterium]